MKKFIVKTTKEFTYNEKGFITKEVVTEESYEQEVYIGGTITSGTIKAEDIKPYAKVTGDNPYTAKFEVPNVNTTAKADIGVTTIQNTNKTMSEIANEIKSILDRDLKYEVRLKPKSF